MKLNTLPKKITARKKLDDADAFMCNQWLSGISFINKSKMNDNFGRNVANIAINRYFHVLSRGNNLSGKITSVAPKELEDLPEARKEFIFLKAKDVNEKIEIEKELPEPPTQYDQKSVICINKQNRQKAIDWCFENNKLHLIRPVKVLTSARIWEVFYVEKTSRFYAIWPYCLTNWPSQLRNILLNGVNYDLTNAIGQFILEQLGEKLDAYPDAKTYLENPKKTRDDLILILGVNQTQAKKILHATVNGARVSESSIVNEQSSLLEIVDKEIALEFVKKFSSLVGQLKQIRKLIAPTNKLFIRQYFEWEKQKTGLFFSGSGLIMHDGIDGCSLTTIIPPEYSNLVKISQTRGIWDESGNSSSIINL